MNVIVIVILCVVSTVACKLIERENKDYSLVITILTVSMVLGSIVFSISPIFETVEDLFNEAKISKEYLNIAFKSIGVCYVVELGCDCCKDNGENALATELEIVGKIALLIISMPLFSKIIVIIRDLLK